MEKTHSIAVTGHRPNKLWGYNLLNEQYFQLQKLFEEYVKNNITDPNREVEMISGMALGADTIFAKAALSLKEQGYNIKLVAAIPFKGQESLWPEETKNQYRRLLNCADEVVFVCPEGYASWKMQKRNEYMVDRCDILLAIWDGTDGGTSNCIRYAQQKKKEMIIIDPKSL